MHPILLHVGPLTIHTYGVTLALGTLAGLMLLRRLAVADGRDPDQMQSVALWLVVAGLLGARAGFLVMEPEAWSGPAKALMF